MQQRVVIHRAGSYRHLQSEAFDDLRPAPGEVCVQTAAIGVNYADVVVRMGLYASAREYVGWPITPGFEFSGRVVAVGEDVSDLAPGAMVFGVTRFGAYATQVVVPRHQLWTLPTGWSLPEAAAFPAVSLTAYYALHELAHPRAGQTLLVHSAAGGVGSTLVQLGKRAGCRVIGVVGNTAKVDAVHALGADVVVDKSTTALWPTVERHCPNGCDVVLDANGPTTLRQSYRHLSSGGKLVVYGFHSMLPRRGGRPSWLRLALGLLRTPIFHPLTLTNSNHSVLAFNLSYLFDQRELLAGAMSDLISWTTDGSLNLPAVTAYPLTDVARAHRDLESGKTVGKLVLIPA